MPNLSDRFLEGNGFGYIAAGLPNITGGFAGINAALGAYEGGCFYNGNNFYGGAVLSGSANNSIGFDASRSSSIYGNSLTVQPAACKCNFVIKF